MNRQNNYKKEIIMHKDYECTVYYKVTVPEVDYEKKGHVDLDSLHGYYKTKSKSFMGYETYYVVDKKSATEFLKTHCDNEKVCYEPMDIQQFLGLEDETMKMYGLKNVGLNWNIKIMKVVEH